MDEKRLRELKLLIMQLYGITEEQFDGAIAALQKADEITIKMVEAARELKILLDCFFIRLMLQYETKK